MTDPSTRHKVLEGEEWWERHRAQRRAKEAEKRDARRRGQHTEAEWQARLLEYDGRCAYCVTAIATDREHVIPMCAGGSDAIDNLVPACKRCNVQKKRTVGVWVPVAAPLTVASQPCAAVLARMSPSAISKAVKR